MRKDAPDTPARPHTLTMENRQRIQITGVEDLSSFHDEMIVLLTSAGPMTLFGTGLHIELCHLDEGVLQVEGHLLALEYDEKSAASRTNVLGKLFK